MTEPTTAAGPRGKRLYQCPGCWATAVLPSDHDYECDSCGEALRCVDLREPAAEARQQDGSALRAALRLIRDDAFINYGPASKVQQMRWIARDALAALPPSAPPAPEEERLLAAERLSISRAAHHVVKAINDAPGPLHDERAHERVLAKMVERHEAEYDALAALPPSAPPALDVGRLHKSIIWTHGICRGDHQKDADCMGIAAEYARLQEPER